MKLGLIMENGKKIEFKNSAKGISGFIILLNLLFESEGIKMRITFESSK